MTRILKRIIAAAAAIMALASCSWLEISPENTVDEKDLFTTGYGFRNALNGIYLQLGSTQLYGQNLSWGFLSALSQEYLTDGSVQGQATAQTYREAADLLLNTTNTENILDDIWQKQYSIIANVNLILKHIDEPDYNAFAFGEDERTLIKGEALALRAILHFDLLRLFAPAPVTKPTGTYLPYRTEFNSEVGEKLTVNAFLENVIKDLRDARPLIEKFDTETHPQAMYAYMMSSNDPHWNARYRFDSKTYIDEMGEFFWSRGWRINAMAVIGLQARVYMYAGSAYHSLAKACAVELYNTYYKERRWIGFTPESDIVCAGDLRYNKLSDDVLWGIYYANLATDFDAALQGADNMVRVPLAGIQELFASDNTGIYTDYRMTYLLNRTNNVYQSYYTRKYSVCVEPVIEAMENPMIPYMRFSEICYILAEICAENGDIGKGIEYLETVRSARGAQRSLKLSVDSAEKLMDEIILDARKDFLCEGNIFYMYKRLDMKSVPSSSIPGAMRDMSSAFVMPIPKSESPF